MTKPTESRATPVPAGRVSRMARLGAMAAGVAGGMALDGAKAVAAGRRPGFRDLLLTPGNVRRMTDDLAKMRGAAMKMGQLLSLDAGEVLPPELADILGRLRADADFMPPRQLRRVLDAAWGPGWMKGFRRFDVRPIAAASIGQVHRAETQDGRDLAIKVQYPGVARSIDSDVANVGALIRMTGLLPAGFDLNRYLDEARRQLREEADYEREAAQLGRFRTLLAGDDRFRLPEVVANWTRPDILAMTYVAGAPIENVAAADQTVRDRVASDLIDLVLSELFEFSLMQTDPNFANYRYDAESGTIILLDFGAARPFAPETVAACRRLLAAGLKGGRAELAASAAEIGLWDETTAEHHRETILWMMETVFAALTAGEVFDFADAALTRRLNEAGEALARDRYFPPAPPMDMLYLQRKLGGLFLLAARLKACAPVTALFARHLPPEA